jgi:hypothetical protein
MYNMDDVVTVLLNEIKNREAKYDQHQREMTIISAEIRGIRFALDKIPKGEKG